MEPPQTESIDWAATLVEPAERALVMSLMRYPEVLANAADLGEPHQLSQYLRDLAHEFHSYYNAHQILVDDEAVRAARLRLITAVGQVIRNGLTVLGISAPERM